nr:PEP-CTERM sorting domain-containing protein [uncultured Massilia sp.]
MPDYRVVPILTAAARGGDTLVPRAINNRGDVLGLLSNTSTSGFVDRGGTLSWLPSLGGIGTNAGDINDAGDVAYAAATADGGMHAALYRNGQVIDLAPLPGFSSSAGAISQSGRFIVGDVGCAGCQVHAASFDGQGGVQDLGTGSSSRAWDVNDAGQAVGIGNRDGMPRAFLVEDGVVSDLGDFGGNSASALAINQAGHIVGGADDANYLSHAYLYKDGAMIDLGTLYPGRSTAATALSDTGMVVGVGTYASSGDTAFAWRGGVMMDLNALLDPASGWHIDDARGINDIGQIAAHGCNAGLGVCGVLRLDPLVPVPEPETYAMLAAGLALLGAAAGRRKTT